MRVDLLSCFALCACFMLPACQSVPVASGIDKDAEIAETTDIPGAEARAGSDPDSAIIGGQAERDQRSAREIIYGTQSFYEPSLSSADETAGESTGEGASFNFRNAPIDAVLNEVLGESFGLNYSLAPDVTAVIPPFLVGLVVRLHAACFSLASPVCGSWRG